MPREYPQAPLVGVGAVVVRDGRVLLVRRARPPRQGEWSLPGGLQKLGETVFAAAIREVREETGIDARPVGIVDVVDMIDRDPDGRVRWHYTLVDVVAHWAAGEPVAGCDAAEATWVEAADVAGRVQWSETARIVARACEMLAEEEAGR